MVGYLDIFSIRAGQWVLFTTVNVDRRTVCPENLVIISNLNFFIHDFFNLDFRHRDIFNLDLRHRDIFNLDFGKFNLDFRKSLLIQFGLWEFLFGVSEIQFGASRTSPFLDTASIYSICDGLMNFSRSKMVSKMSDIL